MGKMTKCKTCGADIAKSAKVCPNCGAKQKKHTVLGIVLVVLGILLIVGVFGSVSDEPKKVDDSSQDSSQSAEQPQGQQSEETNSSEQEEEQEPEPETESEQGPEKTVFGVGEKVELNDILVTLVNVSENDGKNYMTPSDGKKFVVCEFEIENESSKDIAVSSMMSFEAYFDDYSTGMNISAMLSTDKPQLDGTVAAGKKMNGVIGYEVDPEWSELEIRFTPDFWSGKDITFTYSK